ncbi:hypothetical protein [Sphingomonas sp.]|uniref:hypothetical protein n=1 Tax=Sphingomonas sp. TaxID=28214 RepID=UPI002E34E971|nr:hypothetical protein [Sphingomonas sp.]HEX4694173.1 hypothetical protein [Sphingomonas sp.]
MRAPGAEPGGYALIGVRDEVPEGMIVGPLKAGFLCLPAGRLRWDQIARPAEAKLIARAQNIISGNSDVGPVAPDPFERPADRGASATYRVVIMIRTARLKLCVAGLGIGERKPAGQGAVEAVVATEEAAGKRRLPDRVVTVDIHLNGRDPRRDASVYADIVADIARQYAASLPQ